MRLMNLALLKPGEKLSYAIRTQDGRILLPANAELTTTFIKRLQAFGIAAVYVHDDIFDEVSARPCLTDETKTAALNAVAAAYKVVGTKKTINTSLIKNASKDMVSDVRSAIIGEPIGMFNMYAVSDYKCLHAVNVATIVAALACEHGCSVNMIEDYTTAAMLHDIHLSDLSEDNDYTHAETTKEYMKLTREYSVRTYMSVAMHHERFDGTGPNKIAGEKIAEGARMIAIADIYDSLLYGYGGHKAVDLNYAVEQLNNLSGKVLDPMFLEYFNGSVAIYPVGSTVLLNNGFKAVVTAQNYKMPARPKVRLSMPSRADCIEINLMTNLTTFIEKII